MTESLNDYLSHREKLQRWMNSSVSNKSPLYNPTFSPQKNICCLGYDGAVELGVLEIYKDAWGPNFRRYVDFEVKYPHLAPYDIN